MLIPGIQGAAWALRFKSYLGNSYMQALLRLLLALESGHSENGNALIALRATLLDGIIYILV